MPTPKKGLDMERAAFFRHGAHHRALVPVQGEPGHAGYRWLLQVCLP